jgi:4-hydroxythreonine-4-phosphate dehydrogenase
MNRATLTRPIRVAVTLGDPAGVGPEVVAKALSAHPPREGRYLVVGAERHFRKALRLLGAGGGERPAGFQVLAASPDALPDLSGVWDRPGLTLLEPAREGGWPDVPTGVAGADGGEAAFQAVTLATRLAMAGAVDAVCTAPLHKWALNQAGHAYPGHTEILAELSGAERVVMLLQGGGLRVALATIHIPVRDVSKRLSVDGVLAVICQVDASLRADWGLPAPRIAVTGLNPHAGDGGLIGDEEANVIEPAIRAARDARIDATGPFAADSVFAAMLKRRHDAVVAMYHDQALTALKTLALDEGVNITLGLPFIRTSPDHGTAMDIAGRGLANPGSMLQALRAAVQLAQNRRRLASDSEPTR